MRSMRVRMSGGRWAFGAGALIASVAVHAACLPWVGLTSLGRTEDGQSVWRVSNRGDVAEQVRLVFADGTRQATSSWAGTVRVGVRMLLERRVSVDLSTAYQSVFQNDLKVIDTRIAVTAYF
jgi:hypothetical protein